MQALDAHKVASNSQNRMVNTLVRHQRNRNKKVQALPPKQTKQEQKQTCTSTEQIPICFTERTFLGRSEEMGS